MTETIKLVSHPGARAREGFEKTYEVLDLADYTPLFDIHRVDHVERWVRNDNGNVFYGKPVTTVLNDVVVEGNTVHFDGVMPEDHSCYGADIRLMRYDGELYMFVGSYKWFPFVAVHVNKGAFGTIGYLPDYGTATVIDVFGDTWFSVDRLHGDRRARFHYVDLGSAHGRELMEHSDESVVIHDPNHADMAVAIDKMLYRQREVLFGIRDNLSKSVDNLETIIGNGTGSFHINSNVNFEVDRYRELFMVRDTYHNNREEK